MAPVLTSSKVLSSIRNNRGNSIIVVLSLLAVVVAAIQVGYWNSLGTMSAIRYFREFSGRNALVANIRDSLSMSATFRSSVHPSLPSAENLELKSCLLGTTGQQCHGGVEFPVSLYTTLSSDPLSASALQKITGRGPDDSTTAAPARYTSSGALCVPDAQGQYVSNCNIDVFTTFKAHCAGGAEFCTVADSITVRYQIKTHSGASTTQGMSLKSFANIDQMTENIDRLSILPSLLSSSSTNVAVNLITIEGQLSESVDPYAGINPAIVEAVLASGFTGPEAVSTIARAFETAGFTDPNFVTMIGKAYPYGGTSIVDVIENLATWKVTDPELATYLTRAAAIDSTWMKLLIDSEVRTNEYLARELYWENVVETPEQFKKIIELYGSFPADPLTLGVISMGITDVTLANQVYQALDVLQDHYIAQGIIDSGVTDPTKIASIISAITPVEVCAISRALGQIAVTDRSTAVYLTSLVSSIEDHYYAAQIILENNGDPTKIMAAVASYVPPVYNYYSETTESTTTTDTTVTATEIPTVQISEVSLISTCQKDECPALSF